MKNISRRNFLRTSGTMAAGAMIIPSLVSCSKTDIVNIAIVGVGGRGQGNWNGLISESYNKETKERVLNPKVRIVALCDVSEEMLSKTSKLMPNVPTFKDFRVMLDEMHKDIDAVIVSTPDHTHFAVTMAAMEMGKHVYVEKPLAHNIWQLRTLVKAAKKYGVINQLGNQGHASNGIRNIKEWYDQGLLGEVKEVHAWFNGPDFQGNWFGKPATYPPEAQQVPAGLDWDLWMGPQTMRPFNECYVPRRWRSWYDLGNAELGDWACHTLDAPYWALELGSPKVVQPLHAVRNEGMPNDIVTDSSVLEFQFEKRGNKAPVKLTWYEGGKKPENRPEWLTHKLGNNGMIMVGEKMSVMTGGRPNNARIIMPNEDWKAFQKKGWNQTISRIPEENQYKEFINAIRGVGPKPGSTFEYGAGLTEMALVGVLAQRSNKRIEFDAANMKVTNHPELNKYIKEPVRKGWSYGEELW
ncbi:Gfo/Idh/MocA family protein [Saccharicrinis aurantiacus]|uniref:Gfo/Idh/MocA family protein n=1 Tax=Saccharicrinis aurantiacus TaxID=1849719 RepID=UPI00095013EB|nr:Gfo/Idh/MocA family oxidoreductase [Saccharicrinis aurantiacus]